jgi:hypothetical protein
MTISIISRQVPDHTTVSSYTLERLGTNPTVRITFQETMDCIARMPVLSGADISGSFVVKTDMYSGLNVTYGSRVMQSGSVIAVVHSHDVINQTLILSSEIPIASGTILDISIANPFGIPAQISCPTGRIWNLELNSSNPNQLSQLGEMMGSVMYTVIKMAAVELGLGTSDQEIMNVVQTINNRGDNIDSIISGVLEQLELNRRAGNITNISIFGDAP